MPALALKTGRPFGVPQSLTPQSLTKAERNPRLALRNSVTCRHSTRLETWRGGVLSPMQGSGIYERFAHLRRLVEIYPLLSHWHGYLFF